MLVAVGRAAKNTGGLVLGYEVNGLCHRVNCMVSDDVALRRDNADGLALSSVIDRRLTVPWVHAGVPQRQGRRGTRVVIGGPLDLRAHHQPTDRLSLPRLGTIC